MEQLQVYGEYLKEQNPDVKVVAAVEPAATSPVRSKGAAGPHKIQGIGICRFRAGYIEYSDIYDEVLPIENARCICSRKSIC